MKALSDETRFEMVRILLYEKREACICEFQEFFDQDQSVLYRHMKKLEDSGIVDTEKDGRKVIITLEDREAVEDMVEAVERLEIDLPDKTIKTRQEA